MTKKNQETTTQEQIVFERLNEETQESLLELERQRQKSHWESIGLCLVFLLAVILMVVMQSNQVAGVYSNRYMIFSTPILFAYLGLRLTPKARLFTQADKDFPGWRKAVKGRVTLTTGDQLIALVTTLVLAGFVFAVFSNYYHPNSEPSSEPFKQEQDIPKLHSNDSNPTLDKARDSLNEQIEEEKNNGQ